MRVLAIDTALEACSASLLDTAHDGKTVHLSRPMSRGHAEALMPLLADLMDEAEVAFAEVDRIAVTTGPGSFTGLRVGIAAARAIGLATEKPVVGLSTLAAFAAPHIAADDTIAMAVAIDARHGQVYLQVFGSGGHTLVSPRIVSAQDAVRAAAFGPVRLAGNASALLIKLWSGEPPVLVDERQTPDIDWVARLGAAADERQSAPKPLYLRAPDAQPQDAARLPRR